MTAFSQRARDERKTQCCAIVLLKAFSDRRDDSTMRAGARFGVIFAQFSIERLGGLGHLCPRPLLDLRGTNVPRAVSRLYESSMTVPELILSK